jgi:hypothetical protein
LIELGDEDAEARVDEIRELAGAGTPVAPEISD